MGKRRGRPKSKHWAKFRFEILRVPDLDEKFYWKIISCNGAIVCESPQYAQELGARKTVKSLIEAIQTKKFRVVDKLVRIKKDQRTTD